jgi:hypothetical protein
VRFWGLAGRASNAPAGLKKSSKQTPTLKFNLYPNLSSFGVTVLAGALLLLAAPAYAEDTLPDSMMGSWSMADIDGIMERVDKDHDDFFVDKEAFYAVDTKCTFLHIKKLTETSYMVQASCAYD